MNDSRTVMVFPGQGSQRPGMLDVLVENDALERLIDAAEALTGLELRRIAADGTPEELSDTRAAQPLLYLTDWVWGVELLQTGIIPLAVAGHSLGELAALAIAGVYSVEAGLELVAERSRLMAEAVEKTPGGMAAVIGMDADAITASLEGIGGVWVANDNSDTQVVISGTHEGIEAAIQALDAAGARRIVPLNVAGPFHSPLMESARAGFEEILATTEFRDASIPVISNVEPTPSVSGAELRARLARQITAPVRWTETMRTIAQDGPVTVIEAGPGSVLRGLARGLQGVTAYSVEDAGIERITEEVL